MRLSGFEDLKRLEDVFMATWREKKTQG